MLCSERIVAGIERARGIFTNKKIESILCEDASNVIFGTGLVCYMT